MSEEEIKVWPWCHEALSGQPLLDHISTSYFHSDFKAAWNGINRSISD